MALIPLWLFFFLSGTLQNQHVSQYSPNLSLLVLPSHSCEVLTFLSVYLEPLSIRIGIWTHSGFRNFCLGLDGVLSRSGHGLVTVWSGSCYTIVTVWSGH